MMALKNYGATLQIGQGGDGNAAGIGDVAIFDGNKGQSSVKLTGNISIRGLKAKNAYSGTINLNGSNLVSTRMSF